MKILSPVTGSNNVSVQRDLDVSRIISLYQRDFGLDVGRFFEGIQNVLLAECLDTGYRFYYPFNIFGDDMFYQHLQRVEHYYAKNKWEHVKALHIIPENKAVLEIGSGAGHFLKKLLAKKCTRLSGLELNTAAVIQSQKDGFEVANETIESYAEKNCEIFDVVCSFQVLEHITTVQSFINSSLLVLKPGGSLIFCVPNNNPYLYKHDLYHTLNLPPHHAGLWDKKSFENLPRFFPVELKNCFIESLTDYKEWYRTQVNHLRKNHPLLGSAMANIPEQIYKQVLKGLRYLLEGRNILVEFVKT